MRKPVRTDAEAHELFHEHIAIAEGIARFYSRRLGGAVELNELRAFAFVGLLDAATRYAAARDPRDFVPYARARIRGAILDGLRGLEWFHRRHARGNEERIIRRAPESCLDVLANDTVDAADAIDATRMTEPLLRKLDALPVQERAVLRRHYIDGVPFEQIATEQHVSAPRISQIKSRALVRLRKLLAKEPRQR